MSAAPRSTGGLPSRGRRRARPEAGSRGPAGPAADRRRARPDPPVLPRRVEAPVHARAGRRSRGCWPRVGGLAGELGRIVAGTSQVAPVATGPALRRPGLDAEPFLRRVVQAYLATTTAAAAGLVGDVPLGWRDTERMRFVADNLVDALAPSNNPLLSPVAWKAAIDTGGPQRGSPGPGISLRDLSSPPAGADDGARGRLRGRRRPRVQPRARSCCATRSSS